MTDKCNDAALCVATLNVRGLSARRKQYQLSRMFLEDRLNVVVVRETKVESQHGTDGMVQPFTGPYYVCMSHATGVSAGCAVFLGNSIGIVVEKVIVSDVGRYIVVDFSYNEFLWRVICVYSSNL